jgi:hypothetical protein
MACAIEIPTADINKPAKTAAIRIFLQVQQWGITTSRQKRAARSLRAGVDYSFCVTTFSFQQAR